jgi:hypothetical protein
MPHKYFEDQYDDEEVLMVFNKHPVVMRKGLIFSSVALLAGVIPAAVKPELGFGLFFGGLGVGFLVAFLIMFFEWMNWNFSVYVVTDQRLIQITQKGFFHKSVVDIALNQVTMVNYEVSGMQETMLGFGTLMIQTYVGDLVVKDCHHPAKVQKKLTRILREHGVITRPPGPDRSVINEAPAQPEEDEDDEAEIE